MLLEHREMVFWKLALTGISRVEMCYNLAVYGSGDLEEKLGGDTSEAL